MNRYEITLRRTGRDTDETFLALGPSLRQARKAAIRAFPMAVIKNVREVKG